MNYHSNTGWTHSNQWNFSSYFAFPFQNTRWRMTFEPESKIKSLVSLQFYMAGHHLNKTNIILQRKKKHLNKKTKITIKHWEKAYWSEQVNTLLQGFLTDFSISPQMRVSLQLINWTAYSIRCFFLGCPWISSCVLGPPSKGLMSFQKEFHVSSVH